MKLSEWIKLNNIPNNRILKILEYYESVEPITFNDPEDVKAEVEEHGLRWVANKYGVREKELKEYVAITRTLKPEGTPSMGQDRINRKYSEVELFAGTVIRMAEKHGIPVPMNQYLYKLVKEIEAEY